MYGHLRPCSFMTGHAPGSPLLCTRAPVRDRAPYPFTDRTRPPGGRSKSKSKAQSELRTADIISHIAKLPLYNGLLYEQL